MGTSFEQVGTFEGGEARLRAAEADLARRTKELEDARSNDEARVESCWQCQQDVARNKKEVELLMSSLKECNEAIVRCLEDHDETRAGQGKSAGKRSR